MFTRGSEIHASLAAARFVPVPPSPLRLTASAPARAPTKARRRAAPAVTAAVTAATLVQPAQKDRERRAIQTMYGRLLQTCFTSYLLPDIMSRTPQCAAEIIRTVCNVFLYNVRQKTHADVDDIDLVCCCTKRQTQLVVQKSVSELLSAD